MGKGFSKLWAYNYEDDPYKGQIDLYAKWSTAVYKITYENCSTADGVKNSNAVSYTYNVKKTVSVKKPTRAGYLFKGWTASDGKEYFDQAKNCIKAGTAENVKLTANWEPITYEVKLNLNSKDKGTVTLYAIWKPKSYSITYLNVDPDNDNSENIEELIGVKASNPVAYTYNASKSIRLKNPTKYGFVFEGWYTDYDADTGKYTNKITSISKGSYDNITLYGKWRVK